MITKNKKTVFFPDSIVFDSVRGGEKSRKGINSSEPLYLEFNAGMGDLVNIVPFIHNILLNDPNLNIVVITSYDIPFHWISKRVSCVDKIPESFDGNHKLPDNYLNFLDYFKFHSYAPHWMQYFFIAGIYSYTEYDDPFPDIEDDILKNSYKKIFNFADPYILLHIENSRHDWEGRNTHRNNMIYIAGECKKSGFEIIEIGNDSIPSGKFNRLEKLSSKELIYIMKHSNGFIGIDSYPMHIAALYDKPILGFFGATYPEVVLPPYSRLVEIRNEDINCNGCVYFHRPFGYNKCLMKDFKCCQELPQNYLLEKLNSFLDIIKRKQMAVNNSNKSEYFIKFSQLYYEQTVFLENIYNNKEIDEYLLKKFVSYDLLNGCKNHDLLSSNELNVKREHLIRERDTALRERETALAERETALAERDTALRERETALAERDTALAERDTALAERDTALRERETALRKRETALAERNNYYNRLQNLLKKFVLLNLDLNWKKFQFPKDLIKIVLNEHRNLTNQKQVVSCLPAKIPKKLEYKIVNEFKPFNFSTFQDPLVSIVMVVCSNWEYVITSLLAIKENTSDIAYEIILVDPEPELQSTEYYQHIGNLKLINNGSEISGVYAAFNAGARVARGKYLVFLQSDTLVQSGWLNTCLETFKRNKIGVVGAKIIFSNGLLKEAGGILRSDGNTILYGCGDEPDKPEYNFVREVQFVSNFLATQAELFEQIGGFNDQFSPGIYGSIDFCLKVHELGISINYQPKIEVIDLEALSQSKKMLVGNGLWIQDLQLFRNKWTKYFDQPRPEIKYFDIYRARSYNNKKQVLIIDHIVPTPDKDSGSFRIFNLTKLLLKLGYHVTLYPNDSIKLEPYTETLQQLGVEVIYDEIDFKIWISGRVKQFDLVISCRPDVSKEKIQLVKKTMPRTKVIYDTVDLHFLRESRRAAIEKNPEALSLSKHYKELELELARASDLTFVVADYERKSLLEMDSSLKIELLPNIHPVDESSIPSFETRSGLVFVGGYKHIPNVDGVKWFVDEIFPLIQKQIPEVVFYIIGSDLPDEIKLLGSKPGVCIIGWVPEVKPYLHRCRVFVSPLRYGAGMKGKVGQAMSFGLPVVTTSIGAEGINCINCQNIIIADNPIDFAKQVCLLYNSKELWDTISRCSLTHIKNEYSSEVVMVKLQKILESLL